MSHGASYAVGREKVREYAFATGETDQRCVDPEAARAAPGSRHSGCSSPTAAAYSRTFSRPTA